mgnify:FL=1
MKIESKMIKYKMVPKKDKYGMYQVGNVIYCSDNGLVYMIVRVHDRYGIVSLKRGHVIGKLFYSLNELADEYYSGTEELVDVTLQVSPALDNYILERSLEDDG